MSKFNEIFKYLCESEDDYQPEGSKYEFCICEHFEDLDSEGSVETYPTPFGAVTVEVLDSFGGEGQGDDYWRVYKLELEDGTSTIIRRNGWYASYEGSSWDNFEEVKPVQVMVTQWESV
jgi:hypothetical protein